MQDEQQMPQTRAFLGKGRKPALDRIAGENSKDLKLGSG